MSSDAGLVSDFLPIGEVNVGPTERFATAGIGGALLLAGLARGQAGGIAMGVLGGILLTRAVTGHCPAYQALRGGRGREPLALPPSDRYGWQGGPRYERARSDDVAEVLGGPHPDTMRQSARTARDDVTRDSEYSFPASDPPGWRDDSR